MHFFTGVFFDKIITFSPFFISGSDETPPACQSDESVAAALKDIKMAIQATRVLQHQTRIIPSNSNSNNSNMNPTAAAINSTVVSSTVNLTSIELVKYRVMKSQPSFPQILHISPLLDKNYSHLPHIATKINLRKFIPIKPQDLWGISENVNNIFGLFNTHSFTNSSTRTYMSFFSIQRVVVVKKLNYDPNMQVMVHLALFQSCCTVGHCTVWY